MKFSGVHIFIILALSAEIVSCIRENTIQFQKLEDFKVRIPDSKSEVRSFLISEVNLILIYSDRYIIAYDLKSLTYLARLSIQTDSRIKEINYITDYYDKFLFIIIQLESQEFKYFKFFTSLYEKTQLKYISVHPFSLYTTIEDLIIPKPQSTTFFDQEQAEGEVEHILESHPQVNQMYVQHFNLEILNYYPKSKRILEICLIQVGTEEDLFFSCQNNPELEVMLQSQTIELKKDYLFQEIDRENHILFFNNFHIMSIQDNFQQKREKKVTYVNLQDAYLKYVDIPGKSQLKTPISELIFLKLIHYTKQDVQDIFLLYADRTELSTEKYVLIKYNVVQEQILQITQFKGFTAEGFDQIPNGNSNNRPTLNIGVLFYNKNIIMQQGKFIKEVEIKLNSDEIDIRDYEINHHNNQQMFQEQSQFFQLSAYHESQTIPFALAKSPDSPDTYSLYQQACSKQDLIYFASEFQCLRQTCSDHLVYQSQQPLLHKICLLPDQVKERKSTSSNYITVNKGVLFAIIICIILVFKKRIFPLFKKILDKVKIYRSSNSPENRNLIVQDITERERDTEEKEQTTGNEEIQVDGDKMIYEASTKYENSLMNRNSEVQEMQALPKSSLIKEQSSNIVTPHHNKDNLIDPELNDEEIKSSYYQNPQLYSQKLKEEAIQKLQQRNEELRALRRQNQDLQQQYQTKSAQFLDRNNVPPPLGHLANQHFNNFQHNMNNNLYNQQQQMLYLQQQQQLLPIPNQYNLNQQHNNPQHPPLPPQHVNQNLQSSITPGQPEEKQEGDFDYGQSGYIQPYDDNQNNINHNQNNNNYFFQNNNQQNIQNNENQGYQNQNGISINNQQQQQHQNIEQQQNNQQLNNSNLQITQQLNFFKWALDQQFGFNQMNELPNIIGDDILNYSQSNSNIFGQINNNQEDEEAKDQLEGSQPDFEKLFSQQLGDTQVNEKPLILSDSAIERFQEPQINRLSDVKEPQMGLDFQVQMQMQMGDEQNEMKESLNGFEKLLQQQLGGTQVKKDAPFILSNSQIEKLSQSLNNQFEVFKQSNVNAIQQLSEQQIMQKFIKEELKSDLKIDDENEYFKKRLEQIKEEDVLPLPDIGQLKLNRDISSQQEEEKVDSGQNKKNKYKKILKKEYGKQLSIENLDELEGEQDNDNIQENQRLQDKPDPRHQPQQNYIVNHQRQNSAIKDEKKLCPICFINERDCTYKCGHRYCYPCAEDIQKKFGKCAVCQVEIDVLIKLYD